MVGGGEVDGRNSIVDGVSCNGVKLFPATSRIVVSLVPCCGLNRCGCCLMCEECDNLNRFEPDPISDSYSSLYCLDY